jgi:hypothetical protein
MRLDVLDAAIEAGIPEFGPDEQDVLLALRRAQAAYLRASIGRGDLPISQTELTNLRRHAAYLDLLAETAAPGLASAAWYVAATIYEWMSRLSPVRPRYAAVPSMTRGPAGDLIRSSLAYASGLHEGSSAAAAQRALDAFNRLPDLNPIVRSAGSVILSLLARRFVDACRDTGSYGLAVQAALAEAPAEDPLWPAYGLMGRLAEASACQAAAMASGSDELFAEAEARFADARGLASTAADDLAALVDRLTRVASGMTRRSTYRLLQETGLPNVLVRAYGAVRPELWSNQAEAIQAGLLDPDRSFVLSLPTGSGKTFLAQLRVLATLDRFPDSWVAYVAPSRALVREAYGDLAEALRPQGVRVQRVVAGAEAAVFVAEDELPAVTGARTCAVLTPERLDLYLRTNPDLANTLRLVVIDEAHHIGDESRGPRLETLISLIRTKWPLAKPVLLSAFMPNVEEVREWLGDDAGSHASPIRPTRQLRGVLLRHDEQQLPAVWVSGRGAAAVERETPTAGWTKRRSNRLDYSVGALVSMNDNPPNATPRDVRAFAVPAIASARSWTELARQRPGRPGPTWKPGGAGVSDIAVDVAVALSAHPGLVLMFIPRVEWTQSTTNRIAERLPARPELEPFALAVEAIAGVDHDLANALRHGCAYHHSQMPDELARIVEAAARTPLDVLCATSGLQAGVNLPASIVVAVGDPTKPVGASPSARDFANMAGRAGRPGSETEGLALFLPGSITHGDPLPASRRYLAPTDDEIAVVSALSDFLSSITHDDQIHRLEDLPPVVQQTLLALWATNMRDADSVSAFLTHTFKGGEVRQDLGQELFASLQTAADERGARFSVFARSALPFGAYAGMVDLIDALTDHLADDEWRGSPIAQARTMTLLLMRIPFFEEIARGRLGTAYTPEAVATLMEGWIAGDDYGQLADRLGFPPGSTTRIVRAVNALSSALAWGAGSLLSLTAAEHDVEGIHRLLPYFLRFGVDSTVAAYLRLLGVSDRRGASAIAARYPEDLEKDYETVNAWTRAAAGRAAIRDYYAGDALSRTTTERDLGLVESAAARPAFFSATGNHPDWIAAGSIVQVRRAGPDDWRAVDVVSQIEWQVTGVPGEGFGAVISIEGNRLGGVVFVAGRPARPT